jgi:hypothetical protein
MGRQTPRRIHPLFRTTASQSSRVLFASQIGVGQKI